MCSVWCCDRFFSLRRYLLLLLPKTQTVALSKVRAYSRHSARPWSSYFIFLYPITTSPVPISREILSTQHRKSAKRKNTWYNEVLSNHSNDWPSPAVTSQGKVCSLQFPLLALSFMIIIQLRLFSIRFVSLILLLAVNTLSSNNQVGCQCCVRGFSSIHYIKLGYPSILQRSYDDMNWFSHPAPDWLGD